MRNIVFDIEGTLINLLSNAIKYNEAAEPRVEITFTPRPGKLDISFRDNGLGLRKRECQKIFKKFYRVERDGESGDGSSGLGLYFVDNIVRIHHGRIRATSSGPGQGSVFTITLPYVEKQGVTA